MTTLIAPKPAVPTPGAPTPATAVRGLLARPGLLLAIVAIGFFTLAAVAPNLLATYDPTASSFLTALQPPSAQHWFGTDEAGRDLYSRVVYGTRESLLIGVGAAIVSILIAIVLGTIAALSGRFIAGGAGRLIEILFAFPTLLLALLLVAILGPSAFTQVIAVGIGSAPGYARIVRGQILSAKNSGYVEAAVALGHSRGRILSRHILPNAIRPLVAIFALSVGQSIVWASSLAFLGLGVAPPSSEWGALLDAGRAYITQGPWLIVIPGIVIVVLALAATTLGKHIQNHLEKGDS
jgi:peptide/nickel transport system permease protein